MKKRWFRVAIATLLVSSMMGSTVLAAPDVNGLKKQKEDAQKEVTSLQAQLTEVVSQINELEEKLITKGEEITKATEDLAAAEKKEKEQYEAMKLRIKYMYEEGSNTAIEKVVESGTLSEFLSRAEYVQSVHTYDRNQLTEYVNTKNEIKELKATLETEQAELESAQEEFAQKQEELDATLAEKKEEVSDLEEQYQAAVEEAARIAREEEQRRQQQAAAAEKNNANSGSSGSNSSSSGSNNGSSGSSGGSTGSNTGSSGTGSGSSTGTGNKAKAQAIVAGAQAYLGVPYVWGGTSSSGVDCSGLVYLAHKAAGISVGRQSGTLGSGGKAISESEAQPGDVVCYSGHVGIYVGNGQMIHAPKPGQVVCYTNVNYRAHWFRRYW